MNKREKDILNIINKACDDYTGKASYLRNAIGMLLFSLHYGWKTTLLTSNIKTKRKAEKILKINFKNLTPPEGKLANRSIILNNIKQIHNFNVQKINKAINDIAYNRIIKPKNCKNI